MSTRMVLAIVALPLLAGCTSEAARTGATAPIGAVLDTFDPRSQASDAAFAQLNALVSDSPRLAAQAAAARTTARRGLTRLAAIYVLGLTAREPHEIGALDDALEDRVPEHRVIAAGALIGAGEKEAIPVLIEALEITSRLPYSLLPAADHAYEALLAYTGQDFDKDAEAWGAWWEAEGASLRWDESERRFVR